MPCLGVFRPKSSAQMVLVVGSAFSSHRPAFAIFLQLFESGVGYQIGLVVFVPRKHALNGNER